MVYDPVSDKVTDLGLALSRNGLLTMTIDPHRERLYALTYPQAHFLIYDIQTQKTTDMGQVQNWDAISRTLAVDNLGRVYGCWGQGRIWRYDPDTNAIENLHIQQVVKATCGDRVGHGVLEQMHVGPSASFGFADWFDGAK